MISTNCNKIVTLIKQVLLEVPQEELADVVIFGSSAFTLNGKDLKRNVDDLDLFVSEMSYSQLKRRATEVLKKKPDVYALDIGVPKVEIFKSFPGVVHADVLVRAAPTTESQGLLVAALGDLVTWKRTQGRPKDFADLIKIGIDTQ